MSKTNILRRITLAVVLCAAVVVTSTTTNFPQQLTKRADAALTLSDIGFDPMAIIAGEKHMCYRDMGNGLLCAGDNTVGQLGQGNNTALLYAKSIKTSHLPSPANLNDMVGGKNHSCFIRTTGTPANAVYCFGDNTYGQLGNGTNVSSNQAVLVSDNGAAGFANTGVVRVIAGGNSTCAVSATWRLFCWGRNDQGQLGNGNTTDSNIPVAVGAPFNANNSVMSSGGMAIGGSHACATSFTGSYELYCWGDNAFGQIGDGTTVDKTSPTQLTVVNTQGRTSVAASESTTCASANNSLKCWGLNNKGQVGDGSTTNRSNPTSVSAANGFVNGTNIGKYVFGGGHTMCVHADTKLYCWGDNSYGQVPGNQTASLTTATPIPASGAFTNNASLGNTAIGISQSTSSSFICYGRWCWGDNDFGQLSQNSQTDVATPAKIKSGTVSADSVAAPTIVSATFSGNKIVIKLSGLISGAQIAILPTVPEKDPNSMNQMVIGNTVTPTITNGEATVEMQAYSIVTAPNWMSPVNYTVDSTKTYKVRVSQSGQTGANANYPDGFQSPTSAEATVTGGSSSTSGSSTPKAATPTTTVPKASTSATTNVVPGVTVTDTKVYVEAPAKVASASAIDVLTPAQAKTSDIVSKTPSVCLPNDEDLVFIDEGRCIAQVVNEKTRKVLRTLKTTVVADEVSELKVGNEIAVLSPLYFTAGTSTMKASSLRRLNSLIPQVKAAGSILVAGHSGVLMGDTAENRALSRERANTVVAALKKRGAKADFAIAAVGALDPVSTGSSQADQDKNRRAVIVLIP